MVKGTVLTVQRKMRGAAHFHPCAKRECRRIFGCACNDPFANRERCQLCRGVRRPLWDTAREPAACCVGNTKLVALPAEIASYKLAGPGPWFKCSNCGRCQGFPVTPEWWRDNKEQGAA